MNYNYQASKDYCKKIGLVWLGDDFVKEADADAQDSGFTQAQVDLAMRHHLWQIKFLFNPKTYGLKQRVLLALHFLFGGFK